MKKELKKIYAGFFEIDGKGHITWEFAPGKCSLPKGVEENDVVKVRVVGEYHDSEISAEIVEIVTPDGEVLTHQPSGTVLHITRRADGVPPVQSGIRATEYGWKSVPVREYWMRADFFRA